MIDLGFVYFRTTDLNHLDAAWFTLSKQDFSQISRAIFIDNNTETPEQQIVEVLNRYPLPVPVYPEFAKHGLPNRTHSWSVNRFIALAQTPWVFFTRSDYLLDYDCVAKMVVERDSRLAANPAWRGMITSHCHQMGFDNTMSNADALAPHSFPDASWRQHPDGPKSLVGQVPAYMFESSGVDAGVWLTQRQNYIDIGGMNENLVSWGFNQQEAQQLMMGNSVQMVAIDDYLYHHQHHYAPRDFTVAGFELSQYRR